MEENTEVKNIFEIKERSVEARSVKPAKPVEKTADKPKKEEELVEVMVQTKNNKGVLHYQGVKITGKTTVKMPRALAESLSKYVQIVNPKEKIHSASKETKTVSGEVNRLELGGIDR